MGWRLALGLVIWVWTQSVLAAVVPVPQPLQPWRQWALYGADEATCPFYFQDFKNKRCAWPGVLTLTEGADGLQFSADWQLFAKADIPLPGSDGFWPVQVKANGQPALVTDNQGQPQLTLEPGRYTISGTIPWRTRPDSILIPRDTALVQLMRNGVVVSQPRIDADGRLWLSRRQPVKQAVSTDAGASENKLSLRVFRRLVDNIPFRMETRIEMEVGGQPRETVLGKVLFDHFVPEQFSSPLPARIEKDGRLRVQLRPGQWTIDLIAHRNGPVDKIALENIKNDFWPDEEVWVFQARPQLRQVRVEGVSSVDPNQTGLPARWKGFPAYRVQQGQTMQMVQLRRGDPQPSPNQLSLERKLWLDFNGDGFTVEDRLSGKMYRDWRLVADPELKLGSLQLNGQPQVITKFKGHQGVEVRTGTLQATALSRIAAGDSLHVRDLPSIGWQHDVDHLWATLELPPGWRVFTVTGVDNARNTWTGSWNVWDIFIVLIAIVAVMRLRGVMAALISALALVLIYPEDSAFLYLWLNVIAVMAVLFLLPEGRLRKLFSWYGSAAALVLALWLLNFMVTQARLGLYPQLNYPWMQMGVSSLVQSRAPVPEAMKTNAVRSTSDSMLESVAAVSAKRAPAAPAPKIERMDPNLAAQTGPGRPNWNWMQTRLNWSGPVTRAEHFRVYLISPLENRILAWLRVLLGILMLVSVVGVKKINGRWRMAGWRSRIVQPAALTLALLIGHMVWAPDARAEIPDSGLLETLKQRLINANDCTPACVGIERSRIDLENGRLSLRMTVNARQDVYWPVPDSQQQWHLDGVLLDGQPQPLLNGADRNAPPRVLVNTGDHELTLTGTLENSGGFQLSFSVVPHNLQVTSPGFRIRGLENGHLQANALYFDPETQAAKQKASEETQLAPAPIPPFVRVKRSLRLGLNWFMETTVTRVAPKQGAITLEIPLLDGETVTSQAITAKKGKARVELKNGQNSLSWYSALDKFSLLTLHADKSGQWSEDWIVDPSPLWHLTYEGIAPLKPAGVVAQWRPEWRPYPGESLTLHIDRPAAESGATTTIDQVQQTFNPGQRESRNSVRFHLITSKGSEQRVELPMSARVTRVNVDDQARASDEDTRKVIVTVNPGQHWVEVQWHETGAMGIRTFTPAVALDGPYSNHSIRVQVPVNRWVLFAGGPAMGPAVLFWGVLLVALILVFFLGRMRNWPLKTWHWLLLVLGLCTGWIQVLIPVALWFFLLEKRRNLDPHAISRVQFNLFQLFLAAFTVVTFVLLLAAIPKGLLGSPDMGVTGNGSSQYLLNWFVDRGDKQLSQAWFISVPLWSYRALMLLWSLWLALRLPGWLKWGWQAFTHEGYWRSDKILPADESKEADS